MKVPNAQIGWSQEAKLLRQIAKQLQRTIEIAGSAAVVTTTTTTTL